MKKTTIKMTGKIDITNVIAREENAVKAFKVAQQQKAVDLIAGKHNDNEPLGFANEQGVGNRVGFAQFLHRTVAIDNEVGQVIVGFNPFNTIQAFAQAIADKGYKTVSEAESDISCKDMVSAIKYAFDHMFGKLNSKKQVVRSWFKDGHKVEAYKSAVEETAEDLNDQKVVHVNPIIAEAVIDSARKMDPVLKLDEVIQFSIDMGAAKRMFGEKTIDSDKKIDATILAGIPLFQEMSKIVQLSRKSIEITVNWQNRVTNVSFAGKTASDWEALASGKNYLDINNRYQKVDGLFDYVQALRLPIYGRLLKAAEKVAAYKKDDVQKLPDSELKKIADISKRFAPLGVNSVIDDIKQEWLTVSKQIAADIAAANTIPNKAVKKAQVDVLKADRNRLFRALSNKARLLFDNVEKVSGLKISAADRVRLVWGVVLGTNPDWSKLSNIASSLLPEEYILWVLEIEDDRIVRYTKDVVRPVGILKGADINTLAKFNGKQIRFDKGVAAMNGKAFFVSDVELDGIFTMVVEGKAVFATMAIKDVVKVPKADISQVTVRTATVDSEEAANDIIKAAAKGRIVFASAKGNPVSTYDEDMNNKCVGSYVCRANKISNKLFKGEGYGISGKVTFAKVCSYTDENGISKFSIFMIVDDIDNVSAEEAETLDINVPKKETVNNNKVSQSFNAEAAFSSMFS